MLVIIEGPDRTGKSSLANDIHDNVHHFGPPQRHPIEEYGEPILDYNDFTDFVADRFHWGEMVYGSMYRSNRLGDAGFEWMELLLASRGGVTVLCTGKPELIHDRIGQDKFDMFDQSYSDVDEIQDRFIRLIPKAKTPVYRHDFDRGNMLRPSTIRDAARFRSMKARSLQHWPQYIGPLTPDILFVVGHGGTTFVPGINPRWDVGERFLTAASQLSYSYGIVNEFELNEFSSLWWVLGAPPVIRVGDGRLDIPQVVAEVPLPTLDVLSIADYLFILKVAAAQHYDFTTIQKVYDESIR